jgi:protoheme IX farnesyltransferase
MTWAADIKGDGMSYYDSRPAPLALQAGSSFRGRTLLAPYLTLLKLRIVALLLFTAIAGAVAASGGKLPAADLLLLGLCTVLASGGSAALNHYFDRDMDARMRRTCERPLPSGAIRRPTNALWLGLALIAGGIALAATRNVAMAACLLGGAVVYAGIYTCWLKRRSPFGIVIGGLSGSLAVLAGAAAAGRPLAPSGLLLALLVFLWTPAHFWSLALVYADDYGRVDLPTLPAVYGAPATRWAILIHIATTVACSIALIPAFGPLFGLVAIASGGLFLWKGARLPFQHETARAWTLFKLSGVYLGVIFMAALAVSCWHGG